MIYSLIASIVIIIFQIIKVYTLPSRIIEGCESIKINWILEERINDLCLITGFDPKNIVYLKNNEYSAFFAGIFNSQKIVICSKLINQFSNDEILAVVAHEIGHFKGCHSYKKLIISIISMVIVCFSISILHWGFIPIVVLLNGFIYLEASIRMEYNADRYVGSIRMSGSLKVYLLISDENKGFSFHPTNRDRVKRLITPNLIK